MSGCGRRLVVRVGGLLVLELTQHAMWGLSGGVHLVLAGVPDPGPGTEPPGFGKFATMLGWGKWVALGVVVLGFIAIGAQMAIANRRGEGGQHLGALGSTAVGAIVIAGAFGLVGFLAGA